MEVLDFSREREREKRIDGVVVHRVSKSKTLKQYLCFKSNQEEES
jgi:hypothetical protein